MMKYLLVEDERFAYEEMKRMMEKLRPDYQLEAWTASADFKKFFFVCNICPHFRLQKQTGQSACIKI